MRENNHCWFTNSNNINVAGRLTEIRLKGTFLLIYFCFKEIMNSYGKASKKK